MKWSFSMRIYLCVFLATVIFAPFSMFVAAQGAQGAEKVENIDMFVGEVRSLGRISVSRVAVGAGKIIRAQVVTGGELLLIAEGAGSSSLKLWHKNKTTTSYNIRVSETDPEQRVAMQDMIRIKVQMVEFRKDAATNLGLNWGASANGPSFLAIGDAVTNNLFRGSLPSNFGTVTSAIPNNIDPFTSYFGIATALNSTINYLSEKGDAVTIAEPTLTVVNGGSAKFLSGGEIPYSTVSATGQVDIEFKEYGIKLDIYPRASRDGQIYARVVAEVSKPDPDRQVNGAPALLTRKTESQMNVRAGQTIAISGLLSAESGVTKDGIRWLSDVPVLGYLFGSKATNTSITELVVFITPEVVPEGKIAGSEQQVQLYNRSRERLQKIGKKLKYSIMEY